MIKNVPITEKNPERSRKSLCYVSDNFIRFWFRYVYPFKGEMGTYQSPSGAFKRQRGLAQARWRGFAPTSSVGFAIKDILDCGERQDDFANFIVVKW